VTRAEEWGLDPSAFTRNLPASVARTPEEMAIAEVEISLAALTYAQQARGGRLDPSELSLWFERAKVEVSAFDLMRAMRAGEPAKVLTEQHPTHEQFHLLRQAYLKQKYPERFTEPEPAQQPKPIDFVYGPRIKQGQRHEQVALLRERLNVPADEPEDQDLYDSDLAKAVRRFMRTQGWRNKSVFDNEVREALNAPQSERAAKPKKIPLELIVANMEKWRWLPRELGALHIWNNLPAYTTELRRDGQVLFSERIIIGKEDTQTPVFSDQMTHVIFKPEWGVPSSIKIKSLLPNLAAGDYSVLDRRGMRIQHEGREISPARYNWAKTDIRDVPIVMGAGPSNPLGRIKFMFPNHHAVYMHDTPDKHLFDNSQRSFSHGCIRVRNPVGFAEAILREAAGWPPEDVAAQLSRTAEENHRIDLATPIPVHNTYFTVIASADGKLTTQKDIYGHDKRIMHALEGRSLKAIAASDPARAQKSEMERLAKEGSSYAYAAEDDAFFSYQGYSGGYRGGYGGYRVRQYNNEGYYSYSSGASYGSGSGSQYKQKSKPKKHTWSLNPFAFGE